MAEQSKAGNTNGQLSFLVLKFLNTMKYSYSWLKELSGTQKTPSQLADDLMMQGFELEEIEKLKDRWKNFVVGKVLKVEAHPNADRLKKAEVSLGKNEKLAIVCGAPNVREGMLVAVALVRAVLPKNKIVIEKQKVRGEVSEGMLCSEDELMLGKDASGIMDLPKDLLPGESLAKALGLDDWILDLKILPNRAHDCLSHQGMAREIMAGQGKKLETQNLGLETLESNQGGEDSKLKIKIEEKKLCPRYIGGIFSGIKIGPSPSWLKTRLIACGMEPINNVVDITNLAMLEVGSPLHAFDKDKLEGDTIFVRKAEEKEKLELLGDKFLVLDKNDLVIADEKKVLALAGIKGGKHSGIDGKTTKIVLEAANFNLLSIRKTRQRHGLITESQSRFEKGLSPVLAEKAFLRAKELLEKYALAKFEGWVQVGLAENVRQAVDSSQEGAEKLLGEKIDLAASIEILENLGFIVEKVDQEKKLFKVGVPYWRLDIEGPEDLAEEIGRIKGYDQIELQPLSFVLGSSKENFSRKLEWKMKDCLCGLGFDETLGYSFYGEKDILAGNLKKKHWELENVISVEQSFFRQTLLASLFSFVAVNRSHFDQFNLFEMNRTYWKEAKDELKESMKISGLVFDRSKPGKEIFYLAKGKVESFLQNFVDQKIDFESQEFSENDFSGEGFFLSGSLAKIEIAGVQIGFLGMASEKTGKTYGFKEKVAAFELDFEKIQELSLARKREFSSLAKFPSVKRDLSMFAPLKKEMGAIERLIQRAGGKMLEKVELFDVFENQEENKKSLAFHLVFGHSDRTLESSEVEKTMEKIISALGKEGVEARTK